MLRYMDWTEAADLIVNGMESAINAKTVTYDFARLMPEAKEVKCSEFGATIIRHMTQQRILRKVRFARIAPHNWICGAMYDWSGWSISA